MGRCLHAALILGTLWAGVAPGAGAESLGGHRLLHLFDFEEADDFNFEAMPRYWYAIGRADQTADPNFLRRPIHQQLIQRQGFSRHGLVQFNRPQQERGEHNLHLHLNGGSAGAFLEVGALAAVPDSDYIITARVRTGAVRHARARLTVYFVDAAGRRINNSSRSTELLDTRGQWRNVTLKLLGDHPHAAWIGMQAELLQPQHQPPLSGASTSAGGGKHTVLYQDADADAWFDDVAVWQVPRVVVRTQSAVNLIVAPDRPRLSIEVRDLSGQRLVARAAVYDHAHRLADETARPIGGGRASVWAWEPQLTKFGWYLVELSLFEPDDEGGIRASRPVSRTLRAFAWLPPAARLDQHELRRFTLDLHHADMAELAALPAVLRATGLQSMTISGWRPDTDPTNIDLHMAALERAVQPLLEEQAHITLSLAPVPGDLADRLDMDRDNPLWLFGRPEEHWRAYVAPLMMRQGQYVRQWQMGPADEANTVYTRQLSRVLRQARTTVQTLSTEPGILLPWRLDQPRRDDFDDAGVLYLIDVPPAIQPSRIADHLAEWRSSAADPPFTLQLRVDDATRMTQPRRVTDLAIRMVEAWSQRPQGLTIPRPWAADDDHYHALHPDPLLSVFANVARRLAGRRVIGRLPMRGGVTGVIFDGPAGGMLAVWNDAADPNDARVEAVLGDQPIAYDVWGNRVEIEQHGQASRFIATQTPMFIERIDPQLALFRASFRLTPQLVESSQAPGEHELVLTNPWPRSIAGELVIIEPDRTWRIEPRQISFSIEAGQTKKFPVRVSVPVTATAGPKRLVAKASFAAATPYEVSLAAPLKLGLADLEMEAGLTTQLNPDTGKRDAVVTVFVTNTGQTPRSFYTFAIMTRRARQERIVSRLAPGDSIMRRFTFPGGGDSLDTDKARAGIRDVLGPAMMNLLLTE